VADAPRYATLRDYLRVLRQHRVLILLFALVFAGGALTLALRSDEVYKSEASIKLRDINSDLALVGEAVVPQQDSTFAGTRAAAQVKDPDVVARAAKLLGIKGAARALSGSVTGQVELRTGFVVIQSKARTGEAAAGVANAFAQALTAQVSNDQIGQLKQTLKGLKQEYRTQIRRARRNSKKNQFDTTPSLIDLQYQQRIARLQSLVDYSKPASIVKPATVPANPTSPKPIRDLFIGLILGLVLGIVAAFIRDSLDRRLRGSADIREHLGLPIIATLSSDALGSAAVSANGTKPIPEQDFEAVRILRTNIGLLDVDRSPRLLAVTSAISEEGKSTIASNLAVSHALAGNLVLLIECDLRRPSMAHRLGLQQSPGLTDYLSGNAGPAEILQKLAVPSGADESESPGVVVVTAGGRVPRPAELLGSQRMAVLLKQVREVYDVVILDTAPMLPVVDTRSLLPLVDGIVIAARSRQTTRDQATALREALHHSGTDAPTGVVVTGVTSGDESYGYYSYAYSANP